MNTASGAGRPGERLRRRRLDDAQIGDAERRRVAADARGALGVLLDGDGAQRGDRRAAIRWRSSRSRRRRPTAVSRGRGARADIVSARISRLVIWPSFSNQSSGRPGARGGICVADDVGDFQRDGVEADRRPAPSNSQAWRSGGARAGRPSLRSTVRRESPRPRARSSAARRAGVSPSHDSASTRRPAADAGRCAPARGRAARRARNPATPSRAATPARLNAEGCGKLSNSLRADEVAPAASRRRRRTDRRSPARRRSRRAAPGSPETRPATATASASCSPAIVADQGEGAARRRRPARLALSRALAAGESAPSSPSPIRVSQGVMAAPERMLAPARARRNHRRRASSRAASPAAATSPRRCRSPAAPRAPPPAPLPTRIGGFGGVEGLDALSASTAQSTR